MAQTKIEWTDKVWNPTTGCSKVSQGCRNCYAEVIANRFWKDRKFTDVQCREDRLTQPLRWKKAARIFVNSMSDLFHPEVPFEFVDKVFNNMSLAYWHTFQILTKRPERMLEYTRTEFPSSIVTSNIWLGVSVEDQATADQRIPLLLETPAAVRFVSVEPMLGPVDLQAVPLPDTYLTMNGIKGVLQPLSEKETELDDYKYHTKKSYKLDWVIAGGESGPRARPVHPEWVRSLRDQCQAAGVPFFFKGWGEYCHSDQFTTDTYRLVDDAVNLSALNDNGRPWKVGKSKSGHLLDGKEYREFPEVK